MKETSVSKRIAVLGETLGYPFKTHPEGPTLSLVTKWLRETKSISIKIDDFYTEGKLRFDYNICKLGTQEDNPQGAYETYEEALEEAIYEAFVTLYSTIKIRSNPDLLRFGNWIFNNTRSKFYSGVTRLPMQEILRMYLEENESKR